MSTDNTTETAKADESETLADSVRRVSRCVDRLMKSGINRKAVVVLLADATGVSKRQVSFLLESLGEMERTFLVASPAPKKGRRP